VAEGEGMTRLQPAMVGATAVVGLANFKHFHLQKNRSISHFLLQAFLPFFAAFRVAMDEVSAANKGQILKEKWKQVKLY
jgi:hypothetical protein